MESTSRLKRLAVLDKAEAELTAVEQELKTTRSYDRPEGTTLTFEYAPSKLQKEVDRLKRENKRLKKHNQNPQNIEKLTKIISQKDLRIFELEKQVKKLKNSQEVVRKTKNLEKEEVAKLAREKDRLTKELAFLEMKKTCEEQNPAQFTEKIQALEHELAEWKDKFRKSEEIAQTAVKTAKHELRLVRVEALKLKQKFKRKCKEILAKLPEKKPKPLSRCKTQSRLSK